jgi:hypothetical protein
MFEIESSKKYFLEPFMKKSRIDVIRKVYGDVRVVAEWAMKKQLWGHAMVLAWMAERRMRAQVTARFVGALPQRDPLHSLYAALGLRLPPVATVRMPLSSFCYMSYLPITTKYGNLTRN